MSTERRTDRRFGRQNRTPGGMKALAALQARSTGATKLMQQMR